MSQKHKNTKFIFADGPMSSDVKMELLKLEQYFASFCPTSHQQNWLWDPFWSTKLLNRVLSISVLYPKSQSRNQKSNRVLCTKSNRVLCIQPVSLCHDTCNYNLWRAKPQLMTNKSHTVRRLKRFTVRRLKHSRQLIM